MLRVAVIAGSLALAAGVASAQAVDPGASPLPRLKREVVVSSDIVRIGDLIADAGAVAGIAIFRAPDIGETGNVPAYRVLDAARAHGLAGVDTQGSAEVAVTRAGRILAAKDIEAAIARAVAARAGIADPRNLAVSFDRDPRPIRLEAAADLRASYTYYSARSGRFDIVFELPGDAAQHATQRLSGYAIETLPVAVLVRPLARGEIVKTADVAIERRPKAEFHDGAAAAGSEAIGLAVRHAVRAGQPLRVTDTMKPEIVQRNEAVTLVYEVPGLTLTVRGKAADSGAEGEVINVLNIQSKRIVQGTVVGPARVVVRTTAPRLAASATPPVAANPAAPGTE
jgi:flagella basal body P-ring formation protein FlgA